MHIASVLGARLRLEHAQSSDFFGQREREREREGGGGRERESERASERERDG
jgi:hypothetical protein